jgi:zinc/manganese transport system substrate-binding protein
MTKRSSSAAALFGIVALLIASSCGDDTTERTSATVLVDGKPLVVVTYSILGDVVEQLVGDAATVEVIIPNGQDPHDFSSSAQDLERMLGAAVVVANGLDLEEGLVDALGQVADEGVPVFEVTDHVTVRELGEGEGEAHSDEGHADEKGHSEEEHGHDHGSQDPHLWTDPLVMAEMVPDLAATLGPAIGADLSSSSTALVADLTALDAEVREIMAVVPAGECKLVTGHESLGYFAARYGCELIGAVIPSLSSSAEASAKDIAELTRVAQEQQVAAIFTEVGTPVQIADEIAAQVGVPVVELPSHNLPDGAGYDAYMVDLATLVSGALTRTS